MNGNEGGRVNGNEGGRVNRNEGGRANRNEGGRVNRNEGGRVSASARVAGAGGLCEETADRLAGSIDAADLGDRRMRKHVESCLRCQAEVAQYRKLLKAMRSLREELVATPTDLVGDILVRLEEAGERRAVRSLVAGRKTAYLGGLAVATAAGCGAAVLLATRRNRSRARTAA